MTKCVRIHKGIVAALLICVVMLTLSGCSQEEAHATAEAKAVPTENFEAHFLDVGQGDATLLVSDGEAVLIDAGNRDDAGMIEDYIKNLGIGKLKYVVFTHPHEDHIGSGESIVRDFDIEKVYLGNNYYEGMEKYLKDAISGEGIAMEVPQTGTKADFGKCSLEFFVPAKEYRDTNDTSIWVKVHHNNHATLFSGDAGNSPEREMLDAGYDLEADVFQAGHHGSSTSNSYYLLRQMNPRYVVVSCGANNMYGHPHEEALSRFNDLGAEVFRTDLQGTVVMRDYAGGIRFDCQGTKPTKEYTETQEEANYIGNVNSKKYHRPDCGGLPEPQNRVYFNTLEAAQEAGYQPCGRCLKE